MNQNIQDFIQAKRVAVVGASRTGKKFGNTVATELKQRGYQVFLVHPEAREIAGEPCYPNLSSLAGKVDSLFVCTSSSQVEPVIREAAQAGIKNIWLQQGCESVETLEAAQSLGLNPVSGKCVLMYAPPVGSVHGVHRFFAKVFGQL